MLNKNKTIRYSLGYTLSELLVVISIIGILGLLGIPNFLSYQRTTEIKTSAKDMRSFLWEAQSKSEAPSKSDIVYYSTTIKAQTEPLVAPTTWSLSSFNNTITTPVSSVTIPKNVYIKKIELDGTDASLSDVTIYFLLATNSSFGKFYAENVNTGQLSNNNIVITLGSSIASFEYQITLDQTKYQIALVKSV